MIIDYLYFKDLGNLGGIVPTANCSNGFEVPFWIEIGTALYDCTALSEFVVLNCKYVCGMVAKQR